MKYLSHYTEQAQSKAFEKAWAFFCFGQAQFDEKKVEGIKYVDLWAWLICPKENVITLVDELKQATQNGIKQDIAENGLNAIIRRELNNYECYYTCDPTEAINALVGSYPVTADDVIKVFRNKNFTPQPA